MRRGGFLRSGLSVAPRKTHDHSAYRSLRSRSTAVDFLLEFSGWSGMTCVKWLDRIEAIDQPFQGYQQSAYRYKRTEDDSGEPVTLIRVRALMVPPGIPDFVSRTRLVETGPVLLTGRAWAGRAEVARVEVSDDEGASWPEAKLGEQVSPAWRTWSFRWEARPGRYTLCARATDADGNVQPLDPRWNVHGMGNNGPQRVKVVVE